MKKQLLMSAVLILVFAGSTLAQQTATKTSESYKYRAILTAAGAGAGLAIGFYVGFVAFEDEVESDRKLWTTTAVSTAGGAVGGYFLGRVFDKRAQKRAAIAPILSGQRKGVQVSFRF